MLENALYNKSTLVWKGVNLWIFRHSHQLLLNKFFEPSSPTMRHSHEGGKKTNLSYFNVKTKCFIRNTNLFRPTFYWFKK